MAGRPENPHLYITPCIMYSMTPTPNPGTSPEAKAATRKEIQGIIDFLNLQIQHKQEELVKYQNYKVKYHLLSPFTDIAISTVQHSIQTTTSQRDYYVGVLNQYIAAGYA